MCLLRGTNSLTYLLTPWCRVLLEKLTCLQLVKKFPAFHGTRRFFTHKRPPPVSILSQPNPVHIPTYHLLEIHPNIIHPSTPRSPQWSPSLRLPHQDPIHPLSSPIRATCPAHLISVYNTIHYFQINSETSKSYCLILQPLGAPQDRKCISGCYKLETHRPGPQLQCNNSDNDKLNKRDNIFTS